MNTIVKKRDEILEKYIRNYLNNEKYANITPLTFSFLITKRCPLRCKHCFNNKIIKDVDKNELTLDEYEKLSLSMNPFLTAFFGGGEPFVRKDFHEIVAIFRRNCNMQWSSVTTNGMLQDSILSQIEKICLNAPGQKFVLNFSLDGYREQHDLTRGKGVYDKCIDTINQCQKLRKRYKNLSLGIVTTMTTINEEIIPEFFEDISETINPNVISLLLARQSPRDGKYLKRIQPENYHKAQNKLYDLFKMNKNGDPNNPNAYFPFAFYDFIDKTLISGRKEFYCYAGKYGAYIDFDGTVNPCEIINDEECTNNPVCMGNLRDYNMDFKKLWLSDNAKKIRNTINHRDCCENCTHETEGILPSIYFEPNSRVYRKRIINRD